VLVTVLGRAGERSDHPIGVVTLSTPGDLRGLGRSDLQFLGLVVAGSCADRIGSALGVRSATAVAGRAVREGLHLPPEPREPRD
jgi:hypothetical protein